LERVRDEELAVERVLGADAELAAGAARDAELAAGVAQGAARDEDVVVGKAVDMDVAMELGLGGAVDVGADEVLDSTALSDTAPVPTREEVDSPALDPRTLRCRARRSLPGR
jgi:hypothetical protein